MMMGKDTVIKKTFNFLSNFNTNLLVAPISKPQGDLESFINALESGMFDDKLFYGISQRERGFALLDPFKDPGALYVGKMGSGKSIAMKTTLLVHMLANSEKTMYILYDDLKGMSDYKIFFPMIKNCAYAINDKDKIIPVIEMIYAELLERKKEFAKNGNANGIPEYEKIMRKKNPNFEGVARIIFCVEEFHSITTNDRIKFAYRSETEGTVAFKLRELMRVGRSYGITLLAATQKASGDDFPSTLKSGISMMNAFKVSNPNDVAFMGAELQSAADLPPNTHGRCLGNNDFGEIQYPYIEDSVAQKMINTYVKPLKAKMFRFQLQDFQTAFDGVGNDGMVDVLDYNTVLKNYEQYNFNKITEKFLNAFDFKLTPQENALFFANFIAERDGEYYAVYSSGSSKEGPGQADKIVSKMKEMLPLISQNLKLKIEKMILIFAEGAPASAKNNSKEGSFVLEKFELKITADFLDKQNEMKAVLPEEEYNKIYSIMPLARKPKNSKTLSPEELQKEMKSVEQLMNGLSNSESKKSLAFSNDEDDE